MLRKSKLKRYEYQDIYKKYYVEGWGIREISRYIGRQASTVSRALSDKAVQLPGNWKLLTTYEKANYRYEKSQKLMSKGRCRLRLKSERIRKIVVFILCKWNWSPEKISDFLKKYGVKISAKAIYNFIKKEREYLKEYLRFRGKSRQQRVSSRRGLFKTGAPVKKTIHERPSIFKDNKIEPGHWQVDTIHSKRGGSGAIASLRELASKRQFYFLVPDLTADSLMNVIVPFFHPLPAFMRKTILADNGPENSDLFKLELIFPGFQAFYCDPYKAIQRAEVENGNGDFRFDFPKKTDFSQVSPEKIKVVEYKISGTPKKTLGGISPRALFNQLLKAA